MLWSIIPLVAAAVASPLGEYMNALEERGVSVTSQQYSNFKFYAQHAAAAYCNYNTPAGDYIECGGECDALENNWVYSVGSMTGSVTGIGAYVSVDDYRREVVLSVRGSNNIRNFITDIVFAFVSCSWGSGCQIHKGFSDSWNELKSFVDNTVGVTLSENPGYTLVVTGHSLGAAVATIATAYLRNKGYHIDLYNFGSPRVGNEAFVDYVTAQAGAEYRVTHQDDPVPRLPPMFFGYRHTSPEYWLNGGSSTTTSYSLSQIKICTGTTSTSCNAGTLIGLDIPAHLYYLDNTSGCGNPFQWKRDETDAQTSQRLSNWASQDQSYAKGL